MESSGSGVKRLGDVEFEAFYEIKQTLAFVKKVKATRVSKMFTARIADSRLTAGVHRLLSSSRTVFSVTRTMYTRHCRNKARPSILSSLTRRMVVAVWMKLLHSTIQRRP